MPSSPSASGHGASRPLDACWPRPWRRWAAASASARGGSGRRADPARRGYARSMAEFTHLNLIDDVEDIAPKHGMDPQMQARYARHPLQLRNSGLSLFRVAPDFRLPFGHRHGEQEEIYV